jgi:hypothetical protein
LKSDAEIFVLYSKNAVLADLEMIISNTYYEKEAISACVAFFYERMMARIQAIKTMSSYKTGRNYTY